MCYSVLGSHKLIHNAHSSLYLQVRASMYLTAPYYKCRPEQFKNRQYLVSTNLNLVV